MTQIVSTYPDDVPKMIIYCPTLDSGSQLNKLLHFQLRRQYANAQHVHGLVDMFNKACSISKRSEVLQSFCEDSGKLRIIIASTAFGMGVDCANIREVIHWGPPTTLDTYIQETGRAGRDGRRAVARLLYGHASKHVTETVKLYGQNSTICRKKLLYQNYLFSADAPQLQQGSCLCCDICSQTCQCEICAKLQTTQ